MGRSIWNISRQLVVPHHHDGGQSNSMTGDMNDTLIVENGKPGEEEVERGQLSIEFTDMMG
jgi:hypothetical protein